MLYLTSFQVACCFVRKYHSHLPPPIGHLFSMAWIENNTTLAVIIAGRPVNRNFDTSTIEFTRICLIRKNIKNLYSKVLAAARRESARRGYTRVITYIRCDEKGIGLIADNWTAAARIKGRQWHGRKPHLIIDKIRYEHAL